MLTQENRHGWIIVDKPLNVSSTDVVRLIRRLCKTKKVGHAGTLDPLATGVLPVAVGEATKTILYAMDSLKCYEFTVNWGEERTTDDLEGEVSQLSTKRPCKDQILEKLGLFTGHIQQTPPLYSAVRINGERAYALARKGCAVDMVSRPAYVQSLEYIESPSPDQSRFKMICGKGVYVRAIARDLGRELGCYGYVSALRRTHSASFSLQESISLEKLQHFDKEGCVFSDLISVARGLDDILALRVSTEQAEDLCQGKSIEVLTEQTQAMAWAYIDDRIPIAIGKTEGRKFVPNRVFNIMKEG
jgi:tRNA pseudouridine55 synthase